MSAQERAQVYARSAKTEKNIGVVFNDSKSSSAVLQYDEAESPFGKRP